jgi:putative endonuclease
MNKNKTMLGRWGEAQAAGYLRKQGYELVASGYRCRFGEIDLVAQKGEVLAFVEVKLRKDGTFAQPREFVDARKQSRIRTTAECYLAETGSPLQPRFDVAEIFAPQGTDTKEPVITYYENAF